MVDIDFRMLAEKSLDAVYQISLEGIIQYASPSCMEVLGWAPQEVVGRSPQEFILPEDWPQIAAMIEAFRLGRQKQARTVVRSLCGDGSLCWIETTASLMQNPDTGEPIATVLIQRDVTGQKLLEIKLNEMALKDGLTGLANRRAFDEVLEREWGHTLREGLDLSLLLLDVDHFKAFNDEYGHQVGDDCLRTISTAVMRAMRRPGDIVARYGGEELGIILPSTDSADAMKIAELVREAVMALHLLHPGNPEGGGRVTASIGAATALARSGGTMGMPASLLAAADSALYRAKSSGRNRVVATVIIAPADPVG